MKARELNDTRTELLNWKQKIDDLENRSRRSNIPIFGLPENIEGSKPTEFVRNILLKHL